ncbi:MAG: DUF4147 domain-containing protein [Balneolales bacterium]
MKSASEIYYRQRKDLLHIFNQALSASHPYKLIYDKISIERDTITVDKVNYPMSDEQKVWVLGSGKASAQMALAIEDRLGNQIYDGLVVCPGGSQTSTRHIRQMEASHPIPDELSVEAAGAMLAIIKKIKPDDIVFYLMSGGSSALLCNLPDQLSLNSIRETNRSLLNSGANISEMNTIRRHLSLIKGGRLALMLKEANLINLVISDVPGDRPEDIGSGLLAPDPTTFFDAIQIVKKYDLQTVLPREAVQYLHEGAEGKVPETLKFKIEKHRYVLLSNARFIANLASSAAREMGYTVHLADEAYSEETGTIAKKMCSSAVSVYNRNIQNANTAALIYFGESYVNVTGSGKGGRNQELALVAALELQDYHCISIISVGTDGKDGPTDAAGAIATGNTFIQAKHAGLNPEAFLKSHDSYSFFEAVRGLVKTGDTGNNLMDLQIILIERIGTI